MRENNNYARSVRLVGATLFSALIFSVVTTTTAADAGTVTAGSRVTARWSSAIDTTSKSAVNAAYWSKYAPKQTLSIDWLLGSILGCIPGITSSTTNSATLSSLNFVRSLAGLAPVAFSSTMNTAAQRAALIMDANDALSHSPSSSWKCWSSTGAATAAKSNLALSFPSLQAGRIVELYMDDPGSSNTAVGHRRWLLNPFTTTMGSGSTTTANAIQVVGPTNAYRPNPKWVGWPSSGYFPNTMEPNGRWSLSSGYKGVSFRYAQVAVYKSDGTKVPGVRKYTPHDGYAQPTLAWQMPSTFPKSANYTVVVTGIKKSGYSGSLTSKYTVRLFTPSQ